MDCHLQYIRLPALILALCLMLSGCAGTAGQETLPWTEPTNYLRFLDAEPASSDPQCSSEHDTLAVNVYDRLVEIEERDGSCVLSPSLAESWEVSEDGLVYTFHLRPDVSFSNGSALTASDVAFTFSRLLTLPKSCGRDLILPVLGAEALRRGEAEELEGFHILDELTFTVTLAAPCAPFLQYLSTPEASILDEQTVTAAGDSYGTPEGVCVGTGPFVLSGWTRGKEIVMQANETCWAGAPRCGGLRMLFYAENDPLRTMFLNGEIDLLDLDKLGMDAEYFLQGDIYRENIVRGRSISITYLTLNESIAPLNHVYVRRALQMALDRETILQASTGSRGTLENGIYPQGLPGHQDTLAEIPYDPEQARELLRSAGYGDGFALELTCSATSSQSVKDVLSLAAAMWREVGVDAVVTELEDEEYRSRLSAGELACCCGTCPAEYSDPDALLMPCFGTPENTRSRGLCYPRTEVMSLIRQARSILDPEERLNACQELERLLVQDDAAWIPLYSRFHFFVVSDRVEGFQMSWNGRSCTRYADVALAN